MNIIAPTKPEGEIVSAEPQAKTGISPEERARRKAGVDYARGSVRLEGLVVSPYVEDLYSRYIEGEMTIKELGDKIAAHHKP